MGPALLVRNERADDFGLAPEALAEEGLEPLPVDAWDEARPWPRLDDLSALVVFGGAMNCDQVDRFPFLALERSLLAEAMARGLPVLGVCLGAQLLVRALDRPVLPGRVRELGFPVIRPTPDGTADPVLGGLPSEVRFFQWHEDVFEDPPGATILARDEDGGVQAFRTGSAWGLVFHPEVTGGELDRWLVDARATLEPAWGRDEADLRREVEERLPEANRFGRELFRRFARFVRDAAA